MSSLTLSQAEHTPPENKTHTLIKVLRKHTWIDFMHNHSLRCRLITANDTAPSAATLQYYILLNIKLENLKQLKNSTENTTKTLGQLQNHRFSKSLVMCSADVNEGRNK